MTITVSQIRETFAEALNKAAYGKERIVIDRRGKRLAALIPIEDLELLEALENRLDIAAVKKALAESKKRIPYERVRREAGLA